MLNHGGSKVIFSIYLGPNSRISRVWNSGSFVENFGLFSTDSTQNIKLKIRSPNLFGS